MTSVTLAHSTKPLVSATYDERVLVLMPTVRDGERTVAALNDVGLAGFVCQDLAELCRELESGAGVALLTEEALAADREHCLKTHLRQQPDWSDLPLIILAREKPDGTTEHVRESMNVSLVERPVRMRSLLSVVHTALRSRRRQYEVRGHLLAREQQAAALRENEGRLKFALAAGRLGSWTLDLTTYRMECSALCKENFGRSPLEPFTYPDLLEAVHPDDKSRVREAVRRSIAERDGYDVEYRVLWPDGTIHWVLVRGQAQYDADGAPLNMSGVSLDMTDRRRDEEALREADRKKDDFLALLAHELRNPLAPIRNGLEIVTRSRLPEIVDQCHDMMSRQLGHMVRLIDDLLDVSRINRNKMELRLARVALADAIGAAVETARPAIEAAGHELAVKLPAEPLFLEADLTRLAQVFANLLSNSAKYTETGGRISVAAARDEEDVVVTVRDTGIGIPSEALPTIFNMFSQVNRSIERSTGGLGIGLALVRGLVEMHGGRVEAASDGLGKGSEFTVRLPVLGKRSESTTPASIGFEKLKGSRIKILVVDDNRDSADSMAMMLKLLGNEVIVARDGIEGVERAEAFRPRVILMDVGMPRMNGLDATRSIRRQTWGKSIVVIALTGWGQHDDRVRSAEAGCDAHLVKPVNLQELTDLLLNLNVMTKN